MNALRFTVEVDIGLSLLLQACSAAVGDRSLLVPVGPSDYTSISAALKIPQPNLFRDESGKAAGEIGVENGWNARSISISYGATTVGIGNREAFLKRIEPYEGLTRPEATASD